ncbi:MAG: ATP-binding protein [Eubacteriales bacterium]|nr:ATP-binding protein [Eubacteriales bacterium]
MRKKINAQFTIMTVVAIILTVILSMVVYYDVLRKEIMNSLKADAMVLNSPGVLDDGGIGERLEPLEGVRVTMINPDGTVCYDSSADIDAMDNHGERPEIQEAFETGEGEIIRKSDTLQKNTYYYAVAMENGRVLRVAKEAGNMWSFLLPLLPALAAMGGMLLLVCVVLAHFLTKSIIAPVEQMAEHMDDEKYQVPYKEMEPFMDTIRVQHEDIMKSSRMRQEFTANVSHELKTPLTAISGYSELIESGIAAGEDATRFAGEIHKSSQRLLMLINDILRLSELDTADGTFVTEKVDLYELAKKCVDMLQISAEKHNVTLMLSGTAGCMIQANREMIEEIMYNLCSNSIRYNVPEGRVIISVGREGNHAVLTVEDTGIGIPPEDQKRIFERFYRVDKSRSKSTGGTGLGLAIVKHAVAKHDAQIGLWSKPGEGTRIRVVFPEDK